MSTDRLSDLLTALASDESSGHCTLHDVLSRMGDRTYGILFLVLALANFIPSVPGFSGFVGLALVVVTSQLVIGRRVPWIPAFVRRRRISRDGLRMALAKAMGPVRWFERVCKPRLKFLTSLHIERLLGVLILCLAATIMLPIPVIGNIPPAIAIATLALGLIERDGLVVILGTALSIFAIAVTSVAGLATVIAVAEGLNAIIR